MINVLTAIIVPPHMPASGATRVAESLSAALSAYCRVTVASMMPRRHAAPSLTRYPVCICLPRGAPWSWLSNRYRMLFYRSDIGDLIRRGDFDLVHLHNPMPAREILRVARACRKARVPYVVSTHGFNEIAHSNKSYGFDVWRRWLWHALVYRPVAHVVRDAAANLLLSPADASVVRAMGVLEADLFVVPNGIDLPEPAYPAVDAATLKKFGIGISREANQITCIFLANHTANKGLSILMRAFRSLEIPYLLIIGGECRKDVDYEGFACSLKKGQRVIITGRLADNEIGALLRRSDLFVFPTLADTSPLVVFEAMAHGLPVIASHVGGIPHQIGGGCGVLVPPGEPIALATALERLAANPSLLASMAANARAKVAGFATWDDAAKRALAAYETVLEKRRDVRDSSGVYIAPRRPNGHGARCELNAARSLLSARSNVLQRNGATPTKSRGPQSTEWMVQ
jgi:starch synthase